MARCFGPTKVVGRSSNPDVATTSSVVTRPVPGVASASASPRRRTPSSSRHHRHRSTTTTTPTTPTRTHMNVRAVQGTSPTAAPHLEFVVPESRPQSQSQQQKQQRSRSLGPSSRSQGTERLSSSRSIPRRDPQTKGRGGGGGEHEEEEEQIPPVTLPWWANSPPRTTHPPATTTIQAPQRPHDTFKRFPSEDADEDTIGGNEVEYDYSSSNWWNASPILNPNPNPGETTVPRSGVAVPLTRDSTTAVPNSGSSSSRRRNPASSPRETPAIEPAGSQEFLDPPSAVRYATKGSWRVNLPSRRKDPQPQQQRPQQQPPPPPQQQQQPPPSRSFLPRRGVVGKENNSSDEGVGVVDGGGGTTTDRLSDVASDVDSVTKDRYMLACQMLKSAVTEKERSLQPLEKEFILSLLGDIDDKTTLHDDDTHGINVSAVHRDADPLARRPPNALSPGLLRAMQQQYDMSCHTPNQHQGLLLGFGTKHPHTATRATMKNLFSVPSCTPDALSDTSSEKEDAVLPQIPGCHDVGGVASRSAPRRFNAWKYYNPTECPFRILGHFDPHLPRVLTPFIMENLRGFFPMGAVESNFWLKYSLVRDGASLPTLLDSIHNSIFTIIGVETKDGEVFGSFTATPWRSGTRWFGSKAAFVWRLKKSRYSREARTVGNYENEMEVYPCTGSDHMIQYCTRKTIAVGGGEWVGDSCPFPEEPRGIGFMIDGDLVGGETNSCATFANPRLCKNTSTSNEFTIANIEVWTLTPCRNIDAAAKLEMAGVFWATTQASF